MKTDEIDALIGANMKRLRKSAGITQSGLADKLGLHQHQVWKYENARDRISSSRLWLIAEALKVNLLELFKGVSNTSMEKKQ